MDRDDDGRFSETKTDGVGVGGYRMLGTERLPKGAQAGVAPTQRRPHAGVTPADTPKNSARRRRGGGTRAEEPVGCGSD